MKSILIALVIAVPALGIGQTLSTSTPNNGSGGIFLDLTAASQTLSVVSFDTYFSATAGNAVSVEVWTRPGSYAGFDASNAGWTLTQTAGAISNGSATLASLVLGNAIQLSAGQTTAVYLHSITAGGGIRYNGTSAAPPQTTWSNSDLTLFSDVARTGAASFGGTRNSPRTFAGNVNYAPVPEPATLAALGLGVGALLRRRRNR
jgi:hypothetical protein